MPAEKSRNSLPSTSSITTPRPRLATSGYERVYDGEIARASSFTMRAAFGPGSLVLMTGPTVLVIVVIMVPQCAGANAPGLEMDLRDGSIRAPQKQSLRKAISRRKKD